MTVVGEIGLDGLHAGYRSGLDFTVIEVEIGRTPVRAAEICYACGFQFRKHITGITDVTCNSGLTDIRQGFIGVNQPAQSVNLGPIRARAGCAAECERRAGNTSRRGSIFYEEVIKI